MFSHASNFVQGVDTAFAIIFGICLFFFLLIIGFVIYIVFRFSKKRNPVAQQFTGSVKLEIIWTVIPTVLVLLMFYYGYMGYSKMREKPTTASLKIDAIGRMWEWEFVYPNGKRIKDTLVVPKDTIIELNLISEDVNHSFFIPAFRVKEDLVRNYKNFMWFTAYNEGDYDIFCAEYCGLRHSGMIGTARVMSNKNYNAWLSKLPDPKDSKDLKGLEIIKTNGCTSCHSLDGSKIVGPSFKGMFGSKHTVVENGSEKEITVDEAYIKTSIYEPSKQIVKDFPAVMQPYKEKIKEDQIKDISKYLQTIEKK